MLAYCGALATAIISQTVAPARSLKAPQASFSPLIKALPL
jgi:hypothetical protein